MPNVLKLKPPLSPFIVTQKYGETAFLDYYKKNGLNLSGHNGLDLACKHGQPIYASHDGIANYEIDKNQGHGVTVRTENRFEYKGNQVLYKSIYWHLCDPVKEPQYSSPIYTKKDVKVKTGDIIGYADSTGLSTGDHLHFGLKPCDINKKGLVYNILLENTGAIDPMPFIDDNKSYHAPFISNMGYLSSNDEIKRLQRCLQELGFFPSDKEITGYYGDITREAVYKFQLKYVKLTPLEFFFVKGKSFGAKSRDALNKLLFNL